MKKIVKQFLIVILLFLLIGGVFSLFARPFEEEKIVSINQLAEDIKQEKVEEITIEGEKLVILYTDEETAFSRKETGVSLFETLERYNVEREDILAVNMIMEEEREDFSAWLPMLLLGLLPLLILGGFLWFMMRQAKGGAMQALNFSKSKARLFGEKGSSKDKVTFDDVAGLENAKEELKEVVDFLKKPKKYLKIGAQMPRGILLVGSPGTGKTLLARAVASESNVAFYSISGSEFIELFVGVGAGRVRDLFSNAKKNQPSIIFIDELDAIGRTRGAGMGGGHDEREQTLNQILTEMDGFERESTTIVFAATNRPDVLDPALLRPGRFDRKVTLDLPDINNREEILKIHCRNKPLMENTNIREVAERTPGFSGADLANLVNEAAISSASKDKTKIGQKELLDSIEKVLLGPERKSHILSKEEKKIAAYHETGHALISALSSNTQPVRKVSIISRGMAAGYTLKTPTEERRIKSKSEFLGELSTLLGGYVAEKIKFREITTGASNDLRQATILARKLVKEYGMSSLGPIAFGGERDMIFLGKQMTESKDYSEKIAEKIDKEINGFIRKAEKEAERILKKNKTLLEKVSKELIKKETIERKEFEKLIKKSENKKKK